MDDGRALRHIGAMHTRSLLASFAIAGMVACTAAPAQEAAAVAPKVNGRVEDLGSGLKLLRVWGTPEECGYAHGVLMGEAMAGSAIAEFTARFAQRPQLLELARTSVDRLIDYPDDVRTEIEALFRGAVASGVALDMPELEREFDLKDLLIANALDVFGLMGCSGFTVWGERALGGGVLTTRNFDWPLTGAHMLTGTIVLVQHRPDGRATASITWPGYIATVTGISSEGFAAFLHVGTGKVTLTPEPGSWPTAVAARAILEQLTGAAPAKTSFDKARELLSYTSPPAGYLTRVVLPAVPAAGAPVAVFETDAKKSVSGGAIDAFSVVTNHFSQRGDGREASRDSLGREEKISRGVEQCFHDGDSKVSIEEAWQLLAQVERGGSRRFGTLHSLVFRHEPWCFELRVGVTDDDGRMVAATQSPRRFVLTREQVFGNGDPAAKQAR